MNGSTGKRTQFSGRATAWILQQLAVLAGVAGFISLSQLVFQPDTLAALSGAGQDAHAILAMARPLLVAAATVAVGVFLMAVLLGLFLSAFTRETRPEQETRVRVRIVTEEERALSTAPGDLAVN